MLFSPTVLLAGGATGTAAPGVDLDGSTEYLSKTFGSAGTSNKISSLSFWIRRGGTGTIQQVMMADAGGGNEDQIGFNTSNILSYTKSGVGGIVVGSTAITSTTLWYHILIAIDTSQATAANRMRFYINGTEETYTGSLTLDSTFSGWGQAAAHQIGRNSSGNRHYLNADLALIHFIDGQQLTPSSFYSGGTAIQYSGSYGTNGFFLDFAASGDMGNDVSGNGHDFSLTGVDSSDQILDGPTKNY